jgi:hypothetical protein
VVALEHDINLAPPRHHQMFAASAADHHESGTLQRTYVVGDGALRPFNRASQSAYRHRLSGDGIEDGQAGWTGEGAGNR